MTTGYDCEDVLNVVLARPIFSPTDFIQIKGRGTRLFTFKHGEKSAPKDNFALFDFFANCEFFEEEFDYDQKLKLPKGAKSGPGGEGGAAPAPFTNTSEDPIAKLTNEAVGDAGMRIDREMYRERFATQAQTAAARHPELNAAVTAEDWPAAEALAARLLFDRPKDFWNLLKLRDVFRSDRAPSFREILQVIFGVLPAVATREQLANEHFERFVATQTAATDKLLNPPRCGGRSKGLPGLCSAKRCLRSLSRQIPSRQRKFPEEDLVSLPNPTGSYGATFTPIPMGAALPEMARAPAFTPAVRAKVSRMRLT